jgi:hypothetical protein
MRLGAIEISPAHEDQGMTTLDEIRARLAKATPGPWQIGAINENPDEPREIAIVDRRGYCAAIAIPSSTKGDADCATTEANATLIAHAPADLAFLLGEIASYHKANGDLALALSNALERRDAALEGMRILEAKLEGCRQANADLRPTPSERESTP